MPPPVDPELDDAAQEHHPHRREDRPVRIVVGVQSRVGGDGDDVEGRVPERARKILVGVFHAEEYRDSDAAHGEHAENRLGLRIPEVGARTALAPGQIVGREIERCKDLKHDQNELDTQRLEVTDAGVVGRKSAERQRRKSVAHGVEPIHAGTLEARDAGDGEAGVHRPQELRRLLDPRGELGVLHGPRHPGAVDLHPSDPQQRQDGHGEHDDSHAAEPAQQVAPQIDGARQELEAGQHGAAGGGEARCRFEVRLGEIDRQVMPQRHPRNGRQRHPGERHQRQAVAGLQLALEAPGRQPEERSQRESREPGLQERPERRIELPDRHDERNQHGHGERHQHHGEHVRDRQQDRLHRNDAEPWKSFSTASMWRRSVRNRIR